MPRAALLALAAAGLLASGCGDDGGQEREPYPRDASQRVPVLETATPLGVAVPWAVAQDDAELRRGVERGFASVTPENELKFDVVHPEEDAYDFALADAFVAWARGAGKRIRGHTLVWHQQLPSWLGDREWTRPELERVLTDHVRTVVGRYRGRIDTWDVVNEPFTGSGGWRTGEGAPWLGTLGPAYVELALRTARVADPDARLFVNELAAEHGGPKLEALLKLVRDLKARGVPLDGVGLQAHLTTRDPPPRDVLRRTIRRLAALDVDVEITELDVAIEGGAGEDEQAAVYLDVAAACTAVPRCRRITVWGLSDRDSWLGPEKRALPLDADLHTKRAWSTLTRPL